MSNKHIQARRARVGAGAEEGSEGMTRISGQPKGTRILIGETASWMRECLARLDTRAALDGYRPVYLPAIDSPEAYTDSPGQLMTVTGPSAPTCLCPERTDQIRRLAREHFKGQQDVKLFYTERCYRLERPQAGRWREFTQFGCEWLWPSDLGRAAMECMSLAELLISLHYKFIGRNRLRAKPVPNRGQHYYTGHGFEIEAPWLGAQKQVCGGGAYPEGVGFAIGVDRLLLAAETYKEQQ